MAHTMLKCIFIVIACISYSTTTSYMVKMRDGVELNTVVLLNSSSPLPVVLIRTPYGTASVAPTQEYYIQNGYNTVSQDFRGRYASQGSFDFWNHSSPDAYDTMKWIVAQNWSNQQIYTQGVSANGIACYFQAEEQPPWLKGQLVVFGTGDLHTSTFQGGAYRESLISGWLTFINEANYIPNILNNEAYDPFWSTHLNNNNNNNAYWSNIKWPAVHLTGWYDIFLQQQLDAYSSYLEFSATPYSKNNYLVVGPGGHCAKGGQVPWPLGTLDNTLANNISDLLFATTSGRKAPGSLSDYSPIYYYVLGPVLAQGEIGNYWTNASALPTPKYTKMYLNVGDVLSPIAPYILDINTSYIYNPRDPVPTYGGNNLLLPECGPWNQFEFEKRGDIVSFTAATFSAPVAITGRVTAYLYVSSNGTDTDFTVKFTDVYPDGKSMLIQDGILRMKWRDNNTFPSPIVPHKVYLIAVDLWSTSYIFNTGHALRVSISSSNYPRFSANYNNFQPLSNPGAPLIAENTIYYNPTYPSYFELPIVPIPTPVAF